MSQRKDPVETYRRMTRSESVVMGVKYSSKNYIRSNVKRVTRDTRRISQRQFENKRAEFLYKEKLSREKVTEKKKSGEVKYKNESTKSAAQLNSRLAKIRRIVPHIAPRHARLIDKRNQLGFNQLSDAEKDELGGTEYVIDIETDSPALRGAFLLIGLIGRRSPMVFFPEFVIYFIVGL